MIAIQNDIEFVFNDRYIYYTIDLKVYIRDDFFSIVRLIISEYLLINLVILDFIYFFLKLTHSFLRTNDGLLVYSRVDNLFNYE